MPGHGIKIRLEDSEELSLIKQVVAVSLNGTIDWPNTCVSRMHSIDHLLPPRLLPQFALPVRAAVPPLDRIAPVLPQTPVRPPPRADCPTPISCATTIPSEGTGAPTISPPPASVSQFQWSNRACASAAPVVPRALEPMAPLLRRAAPTPTVPSMPKVLRATVFRPRCLRARRSSRMAVVTWRAAAGSSWQTTLASSTQSGAMPAKSWSRQHRRAARASVAVVPGGRGYRSLRTGIPPSVFHQYASKSVSG